MSSIIHNKSFIITLIISLMSCGFIQAVATDLINETPIDSLMDVKNNDTTSVYIFNIREEIAKPVWRTTLKAFEEADKLGVDYILIHINTYGGLVNIADSIRTKILNCDIPVVGFIDNQAISAGALISIACDSIYMRSGGSIGAATVVSQDGQAVPDKYQSFMRSTMRATAEAHGKDTIISGKDTTYIWHRNPKIAESMVDPRMFVPGVSDSGQVLTLTAEEAIRVNFCEGLAEDLDEVLGKMGIVNAKRYYFRPDGADKAIGFLLRPAVQGLIVMLIIGGIYFELQSPGVGFPLGIAILGALLYFAPLYVEGLADNWELIAFIVGLVLVALEVFVIPGFGIAGVSGVILIVIGMSMSMIDNVIFEYDGFRAWDQVAKVFARTVLYIVASLVVSLYISRKVGTSRMFSGFALKNTQERSEGYISIDSHQKDMIGKTGEAYTVLRPSGRVMVDGELFDAKAEVGFIDKGQAVKVLRDEAGQLYVIKA